jgi:hypothetical protein
MDGGLDTQDQCGTAATGELERPFHVALNDDRLVRAGSKTQTALDAGLIDDPDLLSFDGHGVDGANPYAGKARHTLIRSNAKIHKSSVRELGDNRGGRPKNM